MKFVDEMTSCQFLPQFSGHEKRLKILILNLNLPLTNKNSNLDA